MPFELGVFLGAKRYGGREQKKKIGLILDRERFRYQAFLSDIAGQDIREHGDDLKQIISIIRNWLRSSSGRAEIPGGSTIQARYQLFRENLPNLCRQLKAREDELTFNDYVWLVTEWLRTEI